METTVLFYSSFRIITFSTILFFKSLDFVLINLDLIFSISALKMTIPFINPEIYLQDFIFKSNSNCIEKKTIFKQSSFILSHRSGCHSRKVVARRQDLRCTSLSVSAGLAYKALQFNHPRFNWSCSFAFTNNRLDTMYPDFL